MFWKACHCNSLCEQAKSLWTYSKNQRISQTATAEKLNTGSAHVNEILQVWLAKTCMLDGCRVSLQLKRRQQDWNRVSNYSCHESECNEFLYSTVMGDKGWVHHYHLQLKSQSLEYHHRITALLPEIKEKAFHWKMHYTKKCTLTVFWD